MARTGFGTDNGRMSASVHFSIQYGGPALENHQMDLRELAPALLALSTLLEQAGKDAYPEAEKVRVNVQGNFRGGSMDAGHTRSYSLAMQRFSPSWSTASTSLFPSRS